MGDRLSPLPPLGSDESFRRSEFDELVRTTAHTVCCCMGGTKSPMTRKGGSLGVGSLAASGAQNRSNIGRDLREGLRVVILGQVPKEEDREARKQNKNDDTYLEPSREDALKCYKTFRSLQQMDEAAVGELSEDEDDVAVYAPAVSSTAGKAGVKAMPIVSWPQFVGWVQRELDFARDFRYKSVCGAFNRSVKLWCKHQPPVGHKEHYPSMTLPLLFQWCWPAVGPDMIAIMLRWVCMHELQKINHPTPPIISPEENRQLKNIFAAMATEGRSYITADDIAGGKLQDIETKLKNIVDADTVRAVISQTEIDLTLFVEVFCPNGYRAHEGQTKVLREEGTKLVKLVHHTRQTIGFSGWVYHDEDVPQEEAATRHRIDALEDEYKRWRKKAQTSSKQRTTGPTSLYPSVPVAEQ